MSRARCRRASPAAYEAARRRGYRVIDPDENRGRAVRTELELA